MERGQSLEQRLSHGGAVQVHGIITLAQDALEGGFVSDEACLKAVAKRSARGRGDDARTCSIELEQLPRDLKCEIEVQQR